MRNGEFGVMPRFQRSDYKMVARIIRETRKQPTCISPVRQLTCDVITARFVAEFAADNPKFEAGKFRDACGYEMESQP